jgi:hypothetical protein
MARAKPHRAALRLQIAELSGLVSWLEPEAHPLVIQLPESEYVRLRERWALPVEGKRPRWCECDAEGWDEARSSARPSQRETRSARERRDHVDERRETRAQVGPLWHVEVGEVEAGRDRATAQPEAFADHARGL